MKTVDYETRQLQDLAERIQQALGELEDVKYNVNAALSEQEGLLAQYLEDTEEKIPPWEETILSNPAQLELPLGDPNG